MYKHIRTGNLVLAEQFLPKRPIQEDFVHQLLKERRLHFLGSDVIFANLGEDEDEVIYTRLKPTHWLIVTDGGYTLLSASPEEFLEEYEEI